MFARSVDRGWLEILANTAAAQAVAVRPLGVIAANFYTAGTAGPLTTSGPASILIREHGDGTATVCVADPTCTETPLTVTWDRGVRAVIAQPATLTAAATGRPLQLTFGDLTATAGATQQVTVALD